MARIVIVDDNLLCRTLLRRILSDGGHDVIGEAENGTQAPVCVHELRPDLVTLDLVMPGRGGLATLEHLLMVDPSLAVVVCSASLDQRRVLAALRLGAKGFVVKPFGHETVLDAVRNALAESDSGENEVESDEVFTEAAGTGGGATDEQSDRSSAACLACEASVLGRPLLPRRAGSDGRAHQRSLTARLADAIRRVSDPSLRSTRGRSSAGADEWSGVVGACSSPTMRARRSSTPGLRALADLDSPTW